jgi:hypothetical protein
MIAPVAPVWLAIVWLINGEVIVGKFPTLQDCKFEVAYARANQDVVAIRECFRVQSVPLRRTPSEPARRTPTPAEAR